MANAINWQSAPVSRGTVLTTELNSIANGSYSGAGTAIDNTTNGDQWGSLDVVLASLTPAANQTLQFYLIQSLDGTNYEDAPSSTNSSWHNICAPLPLGSGAGAKRVISPWFRIPPGKFKFALLNVTITSGAPLASASNTVTLYTANDEIQ